MVLCLFTFKKMNDTTDILTGSQRLRIVEVGCSLNLCKGEKEYLSE